MGQNYFRKIFYYTANPNIRLCGKTHLKYDDLYRPFNWLGRGTHRQLACIEPRSKLKAGITKFTWLENVSSHAAGKCGPDTRNT